MSVCMAVISITAGSSALPQAAADEYEESGIKLRVYDCETGEESIEVFHPSRPSPMESEDISSNTSDNNDDGGISPNAIIGGEDRVRVTNTKAAPYQYTCYMYSVYKNGDTSGVYSGFMIGPKTAVTAAHCVYNGTKTLDHIVVIPGKNGSTEPYGRANSTKVAITDEYVSGGNEADDWAVLELNWNIGYQSKYPALKYKHGSYVGTSVENTGYPAKYNCSVQNDSATRMISGKGTIRYSEENDPFGYGRGILRGDWDASGGNSGGPVFAYYPDTGYTVIGILTAGSTNDGDSYNSNSCYTEVTRISSDMYEIFMSHC